MRLMITIALLPFALSLTNAEPRANPVPTTEASELVRYDDLDLASAAGQSQLDRRIVTASRRVCDEARLPDAAQHARISACVSAARAGARAQFDQLLAERSAAGARSGR